MKNLIILTGPTAVGKTALSIKLARKVNGEIISADSMQVYRRMDIGTAKITPQEMGGVKHHLIDIIEPNEEFNVVRFKELALSAMDEIYAAGHIPIVVGGTGFYIQALLYDINFEENDNDYTYRNELQNIADAQGAEYLHDMLRKVDPESADRIHAHNIKRVIRALEFYRKTGMKISGHNDAEAAKESPYNFEYFVLNDDRQRLYDRIDRRVDEMLESGLLDEVRGLLASGIKSSAMSMQGLGYKEIADYLEGRCSYDEAVEILKRDTRHFAKRQLTWFRREKHVRMIDRRDFDGDDGILEHILACLRESGIIT